MFFSQGIDIVDNERIRKTYEKYGNNFLKKFLTKREINFIKKNNKKFHLKLANRFAAKEAMAKAMGSGFRNRIFFKDIEIMNTSKGKPFIICSSKVLNYLEKNHKKIDNSNIFLSIADEKKFSVAIVSIFNSE